MGLGKVGVLRGERQIASAADKVDNPRLVLEENVAMIYQEGKIDAAVQRPYFELDDDLEIFTREPPPLSRCVFGGPPTLQEVKDTTSELTDALQKSYENGPTEIRSNHDSKIMQCAKLVAENPQIQEVFYSIVSDSNIYDAMLKNSMMTEYVMACQKRNTTPSLEMVSSVTECVGRLDFICKNPSLFEKFRVRVMDLAWNAKTRVVEMVSNLTKRIYNIFSTSPAVHADHPNDKSTFTDVYGSIAWFALVVIVLVVFKRKI